MKFKKPNLFWLKIPIKIETSICIISLFSLFLFDYLSIFIEPIIFLFMFLSIDPLSNKTNITTPYPYRIMIPLTGSATFIGMATILGSDSMDISSISTFFLIFLTLGAITAFIFPNEILSRIDWNDDSSTSRNYRDFIKKISYRDKKILNKYYVKPIGQKIVTVKDAWKITSIQQSITNTILIVVAVVVLVVITNFCLSAYEVRKFGYFTSFLLVSYAILNDLKNFFEDKFKFRKEKKMETKNRINEYNDKINIVNTHKIFIFIIFIELTITYLSLNSVTIIMKSIYDSPKNIMGITMLLSMVIILSLLIKIFHRFFTTKIENLKIVNHNDGQKVKKQKSDIENYLIFAIISLIISIFFWAEHDKIIPLIVQAFLIISITLLILKYFTIFKEKRKEISIHSKKILLAALIFMSIFPIVSGIQILLLYLYIFGIVTIMFFVFQIWFLAINSAKTYFQEEREYEENIQKIKKSMALVFFIILISISFYSFFNPKNFTIFIGLIIILVIWLLLHIESYFRQKKNFKKYQSKDELSNITPSLFMVKGPYFKNEIEKLR